MELKEQRTDGMDGESKSPRGIDVDRVVSAVLDGQRITMACVLDVNDKSAKRWQGTADRHRCRPHFR